MNLSPDPTTTEYLVRVYKGDQKDPVDYYIVMGADLDRSIESWKEHNAPPGGDYYSFVVGPYD